MRLQDDEEKQLMRFTAAAQQMTFLSASVNTTVASRAENIINELKVH